MAQNSNQSRPPGSFPSPHSYPSPSMSAFAYPPSNHGQNTEAYRASPTGSNVSLPSLNLPPIRTIDGRPQSQPGQPGTQHQSPQQQQQQQQVSQPHMGAPLPPPMNSYYPPMPGQSLPPPQHMNVTSDPNQQPMRYPLPPPDGRMMSGGRHKKEIKRRTKTGCLTCRKRRIKCDEAHPACRNCQKSKRECLGYDPIFKSQPGPPAIQPAPSAAPSMQSTGSPAPPYPPPPQGYVPASSQAYTPPNLVASVGSPNTTSENQFDYHATIDPALANSLQSKANTSLFNGVGFRSDTGTPGPHPPGDMGENNGGISIPSAFPLVGELAMRSHVLMGQRLGKRSRMDELVAIEGDSSVLTQPLPPTAFDGVRHCVQKVYCPQIDKFLETQWFSNRAWDHLVKDARLYERMSHMISLFTIDTQRPGYEQTAVVIRSVEAGIVWAIMSLARRVAGSVDPSNGSINPDEVSAGVIQAAKRVEILETLLVGQYLDVEAPPPAAHATTNGTGLQAQQHQREHDFWRLLHKFLTIHDDEASASHELDRTLVDASGLLDIKENRDVLYSIAVVRLHGARENLESVPQQNPNTSTSSDKLLDKAKNFLEAQRAKGTNQVVQRVCGMAAKAWTLPR